MNTSRKRPLSLCILGGRLCSRAKVQVTGKDRSHTKTIGHWTKLFLIDILLYKNKTSHGTLNIYFFCSELYQIPHMRKYIHVDHKGGLALQCNQSWWRNHKGTQNHVICRKTHLKRRVVALRISWRVCGCFEKHSTGKRKKNLRTVYLTAEIRQLFSDFPRPKLFLPLDRSSISFEDGGLLLALRTSH